MTVGGGMDATQEYFHEQRKWGELMRGMNDIMRTQQEMRFQHMNLERMMGH